MRVAMRAGRHAPHAAARATHAPQLLLLLWMLAAILLPACVDGRGIPRAEIATARPRRRVGSEAPSPPATTPPGDDDAAPAAPNSTTTSSAAATSEAAAPATLGSNASNAIPDGREYKTRKRRPFISAVAPAPGVGIMSETLLQHFRPLEPELPPDTLLPFLSFGRKLARTSVAPLSLSSASSAPSSLASAPTNALLAEAPAPTAASVAPPAAAAAAAAAPVLAAAPPPPPPPPQTAQPAQRFEPLGEEELHEDMDVEVERTAVANKPAPRLPIRTRSQDTPRRKLVARRPITPTPASPSTTPSPSPSPSPSPTPASSPPRQRPRVYATLRRTNSSTYRTLARPSEVPVVQLETTSAPSSTTTTTPTTTTSTTTTTTAPATTASTSTTTVAPPKDTIEHSGPSSTEAAVKASTGVYEAVIHNRNPSSNSHQRGSVRFSPQPLPASSTTPTTTIASTTTTQPSSTTTTETTTRATRPTSAVTSTDPKLETSSIEPMPSSTATPIAQPKPVTRATAHPFTTSSTSPTTPTTELLTSTSSPPSSPSTSLPSTLPHTSAAPTTKAKYHASFIASTSSSPVTTPRHPPPSSEASTSDSATLDAHRTPVESALSNSEFYAAESAPRAGRAHAAPAPLPAQPTPQEAKPAQETLPDSKKLNSTGNEGVPVTTLAPARAPPHLLLLPLRADAEDPADPGLPVTTQHGLTTLGSSPALAPSPTARIISTNVVTSVSVLGEERAADLPSPAPVATPAALTTSPAPRAAGGRALGSAPSAPAGSASYSMILELLNSGEPATEAEVTVPPTAVPQVPPGGSASLASEGVPQRYIPLATPSTEPEESVIPPSSPSTTSTTTTNIPTTPTTTTSTTPSTTTTSTTQQTTTLSSTTPRKHMTRPTTTSPRTTTFLRMVTSPRTTTFRITPRRITTIRTTTTTPIPTSTTAEPQTDPPTVQPPKPTIWLGDKSSTPFTIVVPEAPHEEPVVTEQYNPVAASGPSGDVFVPATDRPQPPPPRPPALRPSTAPPPAGADWSPTTEWRSGGGGGGGGVRLPPPGVQDDVRRVVGAAVGGAGAAGGSGGSGGGGGSGRGAGDAALVAAAAAACVLPAALAAVALARFVLRRRRKILDESDAYSDVGGGGGGCRGGSAESAADGDHLSTLPGDPPAPTRALPDLPTEESNSEAAAAARAAALAAAGVSTDPRWEFPRSRLRLQTVLGQGNFGQVLRAEADDLQGHQGTTRLVAVKTVKPGASARDKADLLRELAILQSLGEHPNVVTLLGCCTEQEPYLLILEYVMYGKLLTFLRDHRQRAPGRAGVTCGGGGGGSGGGSGGAARYAFGEEDGGGALCARDLAVFGYCVARGMEYLAARGVLHRDLAARNVLVDHNRLCKIADFGMARSVREQGDVYEQRRTKGALPIRWMAPESLLHRVFTHKSDVWSFGVLLWEIVTLGSTPYPGLGAREVVRRVRAGGRLERPSHCRPQLYRVMARCWAADPARRPDFTELKRELGALVEAADNGVDLDRLLLSGDLPPSPAPAPPVVGGIVTTDTTASDSTGV